MNCARCGTRLGPQAAFCLQCGQMAGAGTVRAPGPVRVQLSARAHSASRESRGGLTIALWVVGALACVFGAGMGMRSAGLLPSPVQRQASLGAGQRSTQPPRLASPGAAFGSQSMQAAGALPQGGQLALAANTAPHQLLEAQGSSGVPPVFESEAAPTAPMLEARGSAGPPALNRSALGMPQSIRDYLEHVRRCEAQRMQMASSQVADAVGMLTELQGAGMPGLFDEDGPRVEGPPPTQKVISRANAMQGTWEGLLRAFNSVAPPAECSAIRSTYDQVVRETGIMIMEITHAVGQAANDRQQALKVLMSLQGRSGSRIDRPARETDALIDSLCAKYDTRKWFDITADVGGGILGKGF